MSPTVLLVFAEPKVTEGIAKHLARVSSIKSVNLEQSNTYDQAKERLQSDRIDLIVTALQIPRNQDTAIVPEENLGLELLKWAENGSKSKPHAILMTEVFSSDILEKTEALKRVTYRVMDGNYLGKLIDYADKYLSGRQFDDHLTITIDLTEVKLWQSDHQPAKWDIDGQGLDGRIYINKGKMTMEKDKLKALAVISELVNDRRSGCVPRKSLERIGELMMDLLFKQDKDFWPVVMHVFGLFGIDYRKTALCFRVGDETHDFPLESLSSQEIPRKFWGVNAPIYRRLDAFGINRLPLCGGTDNDEKLTCLVINARTSGPIPDLKLERGGFLKLQELEAADAEFEGMMELLDPKTNASIEQRVPISTEVVPRNLSFQECVANALKERHWDVVHFIGHSFFDRKEDKGYLFFPPMEEGAPPEKVNIEKFASDFSEVNFLSFSSCQSATRNFLTAAARCQIPAVMGFRWPIADQRARMYSEYFYKELFKGQGPSKTGAQRLQGAFVHAQSCLHDEYPTEDTWIAPILMLQGG